MSLHFFLDNIIFSTAEFKMIDSFFFQEIRFKMLISNNETLASKAR